MNRKQVIEKLEAAARLYVHGDPVRVSFGTFTEPLQMGEVEHIAPGVFDVRLSSLLLSDYTDKLATVYFHELAHIVNGDVPRFNQPALDIDLTEMMRRDDYNDMPKEVDARLKGQELERDFYRRNGLRDGEDFFHFLTHDVWNETVERAEVHLSPIDGSIRSLLRRELMGMGKSVVKAEKRIDAAYSRLQTNLDRLLDMTKGQRQWTR